MRFNILSLLIALLVSLTLATPLPDEGEISANPAHQLLKRTTCSNGVTVNCDGSASVSCSGRSCEACCNGCCKHVKAPESSDCPGRKTVTPKCKSKKKKNKNKKHKKCKA